MKSFFCMRKNRFLWIFHSFFSSYFFYFFSNIIPPNPLYTFAEQEEEDRFSTDILSLVEKKRKIVEWENNLQVITLSNNHKSIHFHDEEGKTEKFIILHVERTESEVTSQFFNEGKMRKY